jgi:predicted ATPase/class 3 adenylate cyclase/DNA-binding CsgD family transcriptional regulator
LDLHDAASKELGSRLADGLAVWQGRSDVEVAERQRRVSSEEGERDIAGCDHEAVLLLSHGTIDADDLAIEAEGRPGITDGKRDVVDPHRLSMPRGDARDRQVVYGGYCGVPDGPSGTVTFLFTDVEGSTALWERQPREMDAALRVHDEILRAAVAAHQGTIFATGGDAFCVAFGRGDAAIAAAAGAQLALAMADWPHGLSLKVRMGLHTGECHERGGDYFGPAVNRAARVKDAANGSQVVLSSSTRDVVAHELGPATTLIDLGVHELRDVIEPVWLFRLEDPSFDSDPRPPRTGGVQAGNLPVAAGPLLGREADVDFVIGDLSSAKVVTLAGVGGIGKTRLALEVGHRLASGRRDGVWFAALDTVDRPEAMVRSLLGMLGVEPRPPSDLASLIEGLRFRDALLILDNCEHLLDAAAEVTQAVVASCPNVQVLATSREPLDVDGERTRRVRSLSTDDDGAAMALFRLRAAEAGADLDPDRDAEAVGRICRRLDGIPLAIELAAARARSLRPTEIADRLEDMFRLLTGGRRGSAERHRTLRATLEWSYDLLGDSERAVLARLSIFAGSFPLDAAEAIGSGDPVAVEDVVDLVDRLVARSLVVPVDEGEESRFRLLEPVRQLAAEKLSDRGETDATRAAHARWYFDRLVGLSDRWRAGDDQGTWPVAARELPDLKAAFDHLVETGRIDDAQRFAVAGYGPINCHFDNVPLYDWAPRAASLDPDHVGPATASVCAAAAWGAIPQGDLDGAATWLRRGAAAIEAGSDDEGLVAAAAMHHVLFGGSLAVTDAFLQRSLDGALRDGNLHRRVWVLVYAGRAAEALDAATRLGNKMLIALARSGTNRIGDEEARWEARESFWEAAQRCHSFLMLNHAAQALATGHILAGAPVDGLLLLRPPVRDWLLRADLRVWTVLHSIATGLAAVGDLTTAARLLGAIGDRLVPFMASSFGPHQDLQLERRMLTSLLESGLSTEDRQHHQRAGSALDAGATVAEALQRIEALAVSDPSDEAVPDTDGTDLTARQEEVAGLVARGLTNKEIAHRLGISRFTAETHVRNILERLGAASRSEIATWAARRTLSGASGTPPRT